MRHVEESHATDMRQSLLDRFEPSAPDIAVSIEGAGVHWNCLVKRGVSVCSIHCFDYNGTPEYYTIFEREGTSLARARSRSKQDTMAAVAEWMDGSDVPKLYDNHPIVDQSKRALLHLKDELMSMQPKETSIIVDLKERPALDLYELHLHAHGHLRSCRLSYWADNAEPDAEFSWDDCPLFKFNVTDTPFLGQVVRHWITEGAMPSAMRKEFPALEIGPHADCYENGHPIEGEFMQSWDAWEQSCDDLPGKTQYLARAFMAAMRRKGYDRKLRAGCAMWEFILSRSRRHGLRKGHSSMTFRFDGKGMTIGASFGGIDAGFRQLSILLTPEVEQLLDRLAAEPID